MIKVNIKDDIISIVGHSGYDIEGKDIVCASVSSIVITSVNAMIKLDNDSIDYKDEDGVVIIIKKHSKVIDIIINNMLDLLSDLEKQYPKYIKIRRC